MKGSTLLSDRIQKFNQEAARHQERQTLNPFSGSFAGSRSPSPRPRSEDYGKPVAGSLTEIRGQKAKTHICREILDLCIAIHDLGIYNKQHRKKDPDYDPDDEHEGDEIIVSFGELFQMYTKINDKVVGLLIAAKKRGFVYFEKEILFQRRDDDVLIALIRPISEINAIIKKEISPAVSPCPEPSSSSSKSKTGSGSERESRAGSESSDASEAGPSPPMIAEPSTSSAPPPGVIKPIPVVSQSGAQTQIPECTVTEPSESKIPPIEPQGITSQPEPAAEPSAPQPEPASEPSATQPEMSNIAEPEIATPEPEVQQSSPQQSQAFEAILEKDETEETIEPETPVEPEPPVGPEPSVEPEPPAEPEPPVEPTPEVESLPQEPPSEPPTEPQVLEIPQEVEPTPPPAPVEPESCIEAQVPREPSPTPEIQPTPDLSESIITESNPTQTNLSIKVFQIIDNTQETIDKVESNVAASVPEILVSTNKGEQTLG